MRLEINSEGHIEQDSHFTDPMGTGWRVGNETDFICFDFLLLPEGDAIIHSFLVMGSKEYDEDFLDEVWPREEALENAVSMVEDAAAYLDERGADPLIWVDCQEFLDALQAKLVATMH